MYTCMCVSACMCMHVCVCVCVSHEAYKKKKLLCEREHITPTSFLYTYIPLSVQPESEIISAGGLQ